jgi:hypothetical protein
MPVTPGAFRRGLNRRRLAIGRPRLSRWDGVTLGANLLRKRCTLQLLRNILGDNGCHRYASALATSIGQMRFGGLDPTQSMLPRIGSKGQALEKGT